MENSEYKKLLVIYNPHASFGRAKKILPLIRKAFENKNIETEFIFTKHRGHAIEIVACINFLNYRGIIAAGGDGTLFEVINGYYKNSSSSRIPVGVIPTGTGNSFAREVNLKSGDFLNAIEIISKNTPQLTDVAECKSGSDVFYFMNVAGIGFITDVMETTLKVKFLGNIAYSIGALWQMLFLKPYNIDIEIDGQRIQKKNLFVEISNTRYTSNFLMAPNASFDDGLLDITLLNGLSAIKMLSYFPSIFKGTHIYKKEVEVFKAKKIIIKTETVKRFGPDGELFGSTPLEINCLHKDISVYRP
jgi:diacylglycerol kinase (ATP)